MEITKREIIVSIAIVAVMLTIGFFISEKIIECQNDKNAEYQKAVHVIENSELFQYGMDTNVGNAFVYGNLEAVDTVTYDEIGGKYLYVKKVEERYERHEEWVTKKDSKGKKYKEKEIWYDWKIENRESKHVKNLKFCGIIFPYGKIRLPSPEYIETIKSERVWSWKSSEYVKVRFKYYGVQKNYTGTIYTKLADGTISDNSIFYENFTIDETLENCTSNAGNVIFWIVWISLMCGCIYKFYCLENGWLED